MRCNEVARSRCSLASKAVLLAATLWLTGTVSTTANAQGRSRDTRPEYLPRRTYNELLAKDEATILASSELTDAAKEHLQVLRTLDKDGVDRLSFFFDFLDHTDAGIAANAHLEFALAADDDFVATCQRLTPNQVRALVAKAGTPDYRTQLYLAMLAECGAESDGDWLEPQLAAQEGRPTLKSWIAAYLKLKGEPGLDFVSREYLAQKGRSRFLSTYAGLIALRCVRDHPAISKEKLAQATRLVLDNPFLQDLAIFELAYQEDWSLVGRVVEIFKAPEIDWARVPAVNYLRVCPTKEAKLALAELKTIDPAVIKRVQTFFPDSWVTKRRQQRQPAQSIRPIGRGGGGC